MMDNRGSLIERITLEPGKRGGQPCIRGMRITVGDVLEWLAEGMSEDEILGYDADGIPHGPTGR